MAKRELYEVSMLVPDISVRKRKRKKRRKSRKRKTKSATCHVRVEVHRPKRKHYLRPLVGLYGQLAFNFWGVPTR